MEVKIEPTSAREDFHPAATCHHCGRRVPTLETEDPAIKGEFPRRYIFHFPSLDPRGGFNYCPASGLPVREHAAQPIPSTPAMVSMRDFY